MPELFDTEEIKRSTVDIDNPSRSYLNLKSPERNKRFSSTVFLASEKRGALSKSTTHAALWPLGHEDAMVEGLQSFVSFGPPCRRGSG